MRITRLRIMIALIILAIALIAILAIPQNKKPSSSVKNFAPPQSAVSAAEQYLQFSENAVGADQVSPTSWISQVKSLVTAAWYAQLQPSENVPTSGVPRDYYTAHANNWIVKAVVKNCIWDTRSVQPNAGSGTMICSLSDETLNRASGAKVPASSIPFGWGHNGIQPSPDIKFVNQSGNWLVDSVSLSSGE